MILPEYVVSERTKELVAKKDMLVYPSENLKYKLEIYNTEGVFCGYVGENGDFDYPLLLELVELRKISLDVANRERTRWWRKNNKHFRENRLLKFEWWFLWK